MEGLGEDPEEWLGLGKPGCIGKDSLERCEEFLGKVINEGEPCSRLLCFSGYFSEGEVRKALGSFENRLGQRSLLGEESEDRFPILLIPAPEYRASPMPQVGGHQDDTRLSHPSRQEARSRRRKGSWTSGP